MTTVLGIDPAVHDRFWAKVTGRDVDRCWLWTAKIDDHGYGRFNLGGRAGGMHMAHRVAYELTRAEIPDGLQLDHLCRTRHCVNPWHLEPVTPKVNSERSTAGQVNAARQLAITHCPQGHPYDASNTRVKTNGARACRTCDREAARRRYAKDPEKYRAAARANRRRNAA